MFDRALFWYSEHMWPMHRLSENPHVAKSNPCIMQLSFSFPIATASDIRVAVYIWAMS